VSDPTSTRESARVLLLGSDSAELAARSEIASAAGGTPISLVWPTNLARAVEEQQPDLLVLILGVGETWGYEVCADMRVADPAHELPLLLIIADSGEDAIERALSAGADDVVRATSGARELSARFSVQLRNRRHRDSLRSLRTERDHLRIKATVDPLTNVLNRGALEEALLTQLNRNVHFAVMFVDLDHFKSVNDTYGHDAGDNVLRAVGAHLRKTIRTDDIAGRYGGEEFVVGLAGCDLAWAPKIAERHREWIEQLVFPKEGHPTNITASIGVAVFDPDMPDSSLGALLKRADAAVYQAKHLGRNRVVVATPLRRSFAEEKSATVAHALSRSLMDITDPPHKKAGNEVLEAELIKQLNEGNSPLPVIPAVAMTALRMANTPNVNLTSLASLVEKDPFTAARFLAVSNSPIYYRGFRTASLRDALMRMGLSQAREILSTIAHSVALPKYHGLLVQHAERATLAGRSAVVIARELKMNYDPAYLCGLLHNLGEARVLRILASLPTPKGGMVVIEDLVERYHAHAGAQLAEKWNLHSDIVQACALHHDESHADTRPVKIAMLSDVFAPLGQSSHREATAEESATWRRLGMTDLQARVVLRAIRQQ
jgi:diguanylate cyclase (GGDEF)-like protein